VSAGQGTHVPARVAFSALEYVPSAHSTQLPVPGAVLYVPAAQGAHCSSALVFCVMRACELKKPALHSQKACPCAECELGGHAKHGTEPETSLYVPAAHGVQFPAGPVCPVGHTLRQSAIEVDPGAESVSAGHAAHRDTLPAPLAFENVFTGHSWQSLALPAPATSRYLPAPHAVHAVAPAPAKKPNGHTSHVALLAAATAALAEPTKHGTQLAALDAPTARENLPAAHASHVALLLAPSASEKVPAAHASHVDTLLAFSASEKVPTGHCTHAVAPGGAYDPRAQSLQSLASVRCFSGCRVPAGHTRQSSGALAPARGWYVPSPQSWHVLSSVCASSVEYLPAAQRVQFASESSPTVKPSA